MIKAVWQSRDHWYLSTYILTTWLHVGFTEQKDDVGPLYKEIMD